jgi:hypothetical protein
VPLVDLIAESKHQVLVNLKLNPDFADEFKKTGFILEYFRNPQYDYKSEISPEKIQLSFMQHDEPKPDSNWEIPSSPDKNG